MAPCARGTITAMPQHHPSYRSALAHALGDLIYWARLVDHAAMGTELQVLADINKYRHRLGLPDADTLAAAMVDDPVHELSQHEARAEDLMQSVLTALHDYQVRTHCTFTGTIYLAPHDWDAIVGATSYYPAETAHRPAWPHERRYLDPATTPRTGTLFGCPCESCPDLPEGTFVLGGMHTVGAGTTTADTRERAAAGE